MSSGYQKFSSRFAARWDKRKTFASFATFADGGRNLEARADAEKAKIDTPEIQSASVKVAQVAKVEAPKAVCAVCGATDDLWTLDTPTGQVLVHQECARFVPKPEPAEPSAAYQAASSEPDGNGCRVEIVELPQAQRYRRTFTHLQLKPPALVDVARWRQCVRDGSKFLTIWGGQAEALGWTSPDLFGLAPVPDKPHPSYNRLSRYGCTGLVWVLQDREVIALTGAAASIRNPDTGAITTYRRFGKPGVRAARPCLNDFA